MHKHILLAALFALAGLAGCLDRDDPAPDEGAPPEWMEGITRVEDRHAMNFQTNRSLLPFSQTLEPGDLSVLLPGLGKTIVVDMPLGTGLPQADVHMGLFFPDIPGCDWAALMEDVDYSAITSIGAIIRDDPCRLPVVTDIGPYFGEQLLGDLHATEPGNRLGRFLIENLVPHGYIVAQVSVTGTGDSTGCMDLMGEVEQAGVQAAVAYLGSAGFSNGAVAPIGRSYDGSTPWEAVMNGNPYVKTVVPISGLYGQLDLMWKNGSVETRGPGVLWGLYYAFTYTGNDPVTAGQHFDGVLLGRQIAENTVCAETQTGAAQAIAAFAAGGDPLPSEVQSYWDERSFKDEVLANYDGSVYFIHGLQDWNVDPHMAFPFYQELEAEGRPIKGLFGQWGHNYPDRVTEHNHLRWDWAQDLLEWFDFYLKQGPYQPQLHAEVEDNHGNWRIEETWPPADLTWQKMDLDLSRASLGVCQSVGGSPLIVPGCTITLSLGSVLDNTTLAGLPTFHVDATPSGAGGQLYAELRDATDDRRLTHAIMDLRYHAGGQDMQVVVPGQTINAKMEFFPFDAFVPAGHELELTVSAFGQDYLPSAISTPTAVGDAVLRLPVIERSAQDYFQPPQTTS